MAHPLFAAVSLWGEPASACAVMLACYAAGAGNAAIVELAARMPVAKLCSTGPSTGPSTTTPPAWTWSSSRRRASSPAATT
ncbi:MAG: hypothetical protein J3K34DRAFT_171214 [Monoraphidium minutum]|nr:MAG: hypothetical protein J3K34DRAFT_171214 [Monoraphidium minutum]